MAFWPAQLNGNPLTPGLSPLCRFGSNPVAEQYLTVEDGRLSPPGFRRQSSVAEHFLAVEDGFVHTFNSGGISHWADI